ncbi:hypothetical protein DBP12_18495 [Streptomyces sp. CS014]|nr:hypothetical protein DBP12_18495 [Streptomyces sp. CS014]
MAGGGGAEGPVAVVAGLEGRDDDAGTGGDDQVACSGERWGQQGGQPVLEEFDGVTEGLRQVVGERAADGVGVRVAFEPGGDCGGELTDVVLGEGELGCVAA